MLYYQQRCILLVQAIIRCDNYYFVKRTCVNCVYLPMTEFMERSSLTKKLSADPPFSRKHRLSGPEILINLFNIAYSLLWIKLLNTV